MKHSIFVSLFLGTLLMCSCSSDDDNDGDGGNNGKHYLSEVVVTEHEKKFGEFTDFGDLYEKFVYTPDGLLQEKTTNYYSHPVGRILESYQYVYDEKKRLIEENQYMITLLQYKIKYEYNDIDSLSRKLIYSDKGYLVEDWTYEYDSKNRLSKLVKKDPLVTQTTGFINEYKYEENKVIITVYKYKDNSFFAKKIYTYDEHGNLIEDYYQDADSEGRPQYRYTYDYDSDGKIIKKSKEWIVLNQITYYNYNYNADGSINTINLSYNYKDKESQLRYEYITK